MDVNSPATPVPGDPIPPKPDAESAPETAGPPSPADENRLVRERYEKAERLRRAGLQLFAHAFEPTHQAAQIRARQAELIAGGEPVTIAGRVMIVRSFGKAGFLVVRDQSGPIQVYVKKGETDDAGFEFYKSGLDAGDIVGVRGTMFITRHGELTVKAAELRLLTKSMRPLPEKWHGLKDKELRYRQRYVDLIANPEVREIFRARSRTIQFIRRFLDERGYMEVETPMMQAICGGAAARPFVTRHNALDMSLYLRIAPELFLKRLVVGGYEKVYEINRNFRNEGISTRHNPEFTMLELYTAWWDYRETMELTETLIRAAAREVTGGATLTWQGQAIDLEAPFRRVRVLDAVARAAALAGEGRETAYNYESAPHALRWGMGSMDELREKLGPAAAASLPIAGVLKEARTPDAALLGIFEELVEPALIQPTFVMDYPKSLCPLTKAAAGEPATAERFEFYCVGLEMANAYSELNDPVEQLASFEDQLARRAAGDEEAMSEIDRDYVRALEFGMPPCSGLGIGIDRLVMLLTDSPSIRDVILFPLLRPEA
ncbi:MAG: lysine--tRNA ligase [bacterium]|nr:lysine--tRNA ligase [bacterium]